MTTNQKVVGSNPAGLTAETPEESTPLGFFFVLAISSFLAIFGAGGQHGCQQIRRLIFGQKVISGRP